MKIRTLLSTAVLAIVALALTVPAVGQSSMTWKISLHGATARSYGTAEYFSADAAKASIRFTVETTTPSLVDGTKLNVFIGPATNPREPYGKLVGTIDVDGGVGAMILSAAKAPAVHDGTTVSIIEQGETAAGERILKGTF
jgi:hypothetical protein